MTRSFQLSAGHPALDFVNTLDNRFADSGPNDLLASYADLLDFVRQAGLIDLRTIKALADREHSRNALSTLDLARELREALAALFYDNPGKRRAPSDAVMRTLQWHFLNADGRRKLVWRRGSETVAEAGHVAWTWERSKPDLELPLWLIEQSASALLTSTAMAHVHLCGSETCRWLFLDTTRNHSRRWCDMKICGNRMKARRFQTRHEL